MGTTVNEDNAQFAEVLRDFDVSADAAASGRLIFAGNHWPAGVINPGAPNTTPASKQMRREIEYAFGEARAMLTAAFVKAGAGSKNDEEAGLLMKKWFGSRNTSPGQNDWWKGAYRIIGRLQAQLSRDLNLYYRGDDSLIGRPGDYPGDASPLTAQDVRGYAETAAGAEDGNIGLCKLFFRRESGGVFKTAQKGRDSIGGCLVHELSHNYCGTEDHDAVGGGTCYGEAGCRELAKKRKRSAWYNADNIEYFCEDVYYGVLASKAAIASGSVNTVSNLGAAYQQLQDAIQARPWEQDGGRAIGPALRPRPAPGGPRAPAPAPVPGRVSAMKAIFEVAAVSKNPSLSIK
jgi:hypothetical protein